MLVLLYIVCQLLRFPFGETPFILATRTILLRAVRDRPVAFRCSKSVSGLTDS